jgi:hypothetical protein
MDVRQVTPTVRTSALNRRQSLRTGQVFEPLPPPRGAGSHAPAANLRWSGAYASVTVRFFMEPSPAVLQTI